jgi:hypothetical protein
MSTDASAPPVNERKRSFHNWRKAPSPLPRQQLDRLGLITQFAYKALGDRDSAMAFLNTYHDSLGARPLDLAGASVAGYAAVCGEVLRLASPLPSPRSH